MSLKNILCVAAMAALTASPVLAVPAINLNDTGAGVATLQVILDAEGSIATELDLTLGTGLTLTDVTIADMVSFDTPNPGTSTLFATPTDGLNFDTGTGNIFGAYGSPILSAGTYDFLTINYSGAGDINAFGLVAQLGVNTTGLSDTLTVGGDVGLVGDTNDDGLINTLDIDPFVLALTDPSGYEAAFPGVDRVFRADINSDTTVNTLDIDPFVALLTGGAPSAASAAPEPATMALAGLAAAGILGFRRR